MLQSAHASVVDKQQQLNQGPTAGGEVAKKLHNSLIRDAVYLGMVLFVLCYYDTFEINS